jgi:hypothetical protein
MTATLLSQSGKITRPELQVVPVPRSTATHRPLSHYKIVEVLLETSASATSGSSATNTPSRATDALNQGGRAFGESCRMAY